MPTQIVTSTNQQALAYSPATHIDKLCDGSLVVVDYDGTNINLYQVTSPTSSPSASSVQTFTTVGVAPFVASLFVLNTGTTSSDVWVAYGSNSSSTNTIKVAHGTYTASGSSWSFDNTGTLVGATSLQFALPTIVWTGSNIIVGSRTFNATNYTWQVWRTATKNGSTGWSGPTQLASTANGATTHYYGRLLHDDTNGCTIAVYSLTGDSIKARVIADASDPITLANWSSEAALSGTVGVGAANIAATLDPTNKNLHATWTNASASPNPNYVLTTYTTTTLTPGTSFTVTGGGGTGATNPTIGVDIGGTVYLFWGSGATGAASDISYATLVSPYASGNLSSVTNLTNASASDNAYPHVAARPFSTYVPLIYEKSVSSPYSVQLDTSISAASITKTRTITPAQIRLIATNTRVVPSSLRLLATNTRAVPSSVRLLATNTRAVPSSAFLLATNTRTVPSSLRLIQTNTRAVPSSARLVAIKTRTVPASTNITKTNIRTVSTQANLQSAIQTFTRTITPAQARLVATNTRQIPATFRLIQTNKRTVPSSARLLTTLTRSVPSSARLLATNTRTVPSLARLLAANKRVIPALADFAITNTRVVPVAIAMYRQRTVPATVNFKATSTRVVPATMNILSTTAGTGIGDLAVSTKTQNWVNSGSGTETDVLYTDNQNYGWQVGIIPSYGGAVIAPWYEWNNGAAAGAGTLKYGGSQTDLDTVTGTNGTNPDGWTHSLEQSGSVSFNSGFDGSETYTFAAGGSLTEQAPSGTPFRRYYKALVKDGAAFQTGLKSTVWSCIYPGDPGMVVDRIDWINPTGSAVSLTTLNLTSIGGLLDTSATPAGVWTHTNAHYGILGTTNSGTIPSTLTTGEPDYFYITPAAGNSYNQTIGLVAVKGTVLGATGYNWSPQYQYQESTTASTSNDRLKILYQTPGSFSIPANTTQSYYVLKVLRRNLTATDAQAIAADYLNPGSPSVTLGAGLTQSSNTPAGRTASIFNWDERAWVVQASSNQATVQLDMTPTNVTVRYKPIFKITSFTASLAPTVKWGGATLTAGVDYRYTIDSANQVLYVQLYFDVVTSGATTGQKNNAALAITPTINTSTRVVPATVNLKSVGARAVPSTARLLATNTRNVPSSARLLATNTRTITPAQARLVATNTRTIAPAFARLLGTQTRQVPSQVRLLATNTRTINPAQARLLATNTRTITPAQARLISTGTRVVPSSSRLLGTQARAISPAQVRLLAINKRVVPALVNVGNSSTRVVPVSARFIATNTRAVPATFRLIQTNTRVIPATARLANVGTRTVPVTARLARTLSRAVPATVNLFATTQNRQVPVSIYLRATLTRTIPTTLRLVQANTRVVPASARLRTTNTRTVPVTVNLSALITNTRVVPASTRLIQTNTRVVPVSSRLQATNTRQVPSQFRLVATLTRSAPASARLVRTNTRTAPAQAMLRATLTRSVPVQAWLRATNTHVIPVQTGLVRTLTRTVPAQARLLGTPTRAVPVQFRLIATNIHTMPVRANITWTFTRAVPASARLIATNTRSIPVTAYIEGWVLAKPMTTFVSGSSLMMNFP